MQRLVVLLSCLASTGLAQDASPSPTSCTVAGKSWSDGFTYLTGQAGVYPSIYAECKDGVPTCYRQTRERDLEREPVKCDEQEIHALRRRLGIYVPQQDMRWPQGVICYNWGNAPFNAQQKQIFTGAMDEYHQKTAVRFVTLDECKQKYAGKNVCNNCQHAFTFQQKENACYATLGYGPRRESVLNFGQNCFNDGHHIAVHELGHITGLVHEHMHPDREVVIIRSELRVSPDNYQKDTRSTKTKYDRQSVMHYRRDGGMCIPRDLKKKYCDVMEQAGQGGCVAATSADCDSSQDKSFGYATGLAASDIETLSKMYGSAKNNDNTGNETNSPAPSTSGPPSSDRPSSAPPTSGRPSSMPPTSGRPAATSTRQTPRPPIASRKPSNVGGDADTDDLNIGSNNNNGNDSDTTNNNTDDNNTDDTNNGADNMANIDWNKIFGDEFNKMINNNGNPGSVNVTGNTGNTGADADPSANVNGFDLDAIMKKMKMGNSFRQTN